MSQNLPAPPYNDEVVYRPSKGPEGDLAYLMTPVWQDSFVAQQQRINQTAYQFPNTIDLDSQDTSIGTTPIPLPSLSAGLYRVSVYARITQAATVSSSLQVSILFTDTGSSAIANTASQTGNTTASVISQDLPIHVDQATPISYATTRNSVGATPMKFSLRIAVEQLPS